MNNEFIYRGFESRIPDSWYTEGRLDLQKVEVGISTIDFLMSKMQPKVPKVHPAIVREYDSFIKRLQKGNTLHTVEKVFSVYTDYGMFYQILYTTGKSHKVPDRNYKLLYLKKDGSFRLVSVAQVVESDLTGTLIDLECYPLPDETKELQVPEILSKIVRVSKDRYSFVVSGSSNSKVRLACTDLVYFKLPVDPLIGGTIPELKEDRWYARTIEEMYNNVLCGVVELYYDEDKHTTKGKPIDLQEMIGRLLYG